MYTMNIHFYFLSSTIIGLDLSVYICKKFDLRLLQMRKTTGPQTGMKEAIGSGRGSSARASSASSPFCSTPLLNANIMVVAYYFSTSPISSADCGLPPRLSHPCGFNMMMVLTKLEE